jgi:hypothetical protein
MLWMPLLTTSAIAGLVVTGIAYPSFAEEMRWPIGALAAKDGWYLYHGVAALAVLFAAWKFGTLLGILIVVGLGFVIAFALVLLFRSWSQAISTLSVPAAAVWFWMIP